VTYATQVSRQNDQKLTEIAPRNTPQQQQWTTIERNKPKENKAEENYSQRNNERERRSYSEVISNPGNNKTRKISKKRASQVLLQSVQEAMEPQTFEKIHFIARPLKGEYTRGQRIRQIDEILRILKIKNSTVAFSLIGKQVVEIYVPTKSVEKVQDALYIRGVQLVTDFEPMKPASFEGAKAPTDESIINRLAKLLERSSTRNLSETILSDYPIRIQNEATKLYIQRKHEKTGQNNRATRQNEVENEDQNMNIDEEIKVAEKSADLNV
jgi:hypothetical protein